MNDALEQLQALLKNGQVSTSPSMLEQHGRDEISRKYAPRWRWLMRSLERTCKPCWNGAALNAFPSSHSVQEPAWRVRWCLRVPMSLSSAWICPA